MTAVALYFRLVGAGLRGQMQYKASFLMATLGLAVISTLDFLVIALLLGRFPAVGGWTLPEVGLLFGFTTLALGLADTFARGFDSAFEQMMQRGTFDTILVRPAGAFLQVLGSELRLSRLGRVFQALAVLAWAFSAVPIAWTPQKVVLVPVTVASGTLIYLGLMVAGATLCFWTVKTPEVVNAFTYGGNLLTSYPMSIYPDWLRRVFFFVTPVAFCNYPLALALLGRRDPFGLPDWAAWAAPVAGAATFFAALSFWRLGVSRYQSAGN